MKKTITKTSQGPSASGPYSLGVVSEGKYLFVSGQGPYDPATGKYARGAIEEQTELTLKNVQRIVEAAGGKMENAVCCRVYLQPLDVQTFERMNSVYAKFFGPNKPARTTIGAQLLNIDVEIDCVVVMD